MATGTDHATLLRDVRRAASARVRAEATWRAAIVNAKADGLSLRMIAAVAGVNHVRVKQIVDEASDAVV